MTLRQMADEIEEKQAIKIQEITCGTYSLYALPAPCLNTENKDTRIIRMMLKKREKVVELWEKSLEVSLEAQVRMMSGQSEKTALLPYAGMQFIPLDIRHEMPEDVHEYRMAKIYYEIPGGYQPKTELQLTNN